VNTRNRLPAHQSMIRLIMFVSNLRSRCQPSVSYGWQAVAEVVHRRAEREGGRMNVTHTITAR
jgi:hypothetical protein